MFLMSSCSNRVKPASRRSFSVRAGPMQVPRPVLLRERLGHAMEDAEAIINGAEIIDVIFEPISRLGLHSEQDAIRVQQ